MFVCLHGNVPKSSHVITNFNSSITVNLARHFYVYNQAWGNIHDLLQESLTDDQLHTSKYIGVK